MTFKQKVLQLDMLSNLLLLPSLMSMFLAFSFAGVKYPWNSGQVIGPLVTSAILLVAFIYNQFRLGDGAALPPRVIQHRTVIPGFVFLMCTNSTGNVLEYYLPTSYQTVRGYSPAKSGYMMTPIIVGATIGSLVHGAGMTAFGYYAPFMLFASIIMPIAAGLITTLNITTTFVQLIMYTAFAGLAYGIGFSGPQNASFGLAVAIVIVQVLFTNQLWANLNGVVPGLSRTTIENQSLTEILAKAPPNMVREVLVGIDISIIQAWYLVVGLACATIIGSLLIEW
ncbi:hypothetical protein ACJ73_00095 [Blastomyces percursus]|uniref:Uncharacterized protein n=1 Tax=Blastomyces percursus TaxID=1658174 RepID=A0A1J9QJ47_9EURO|nr:hypothetical protein ACJ73_00095 [Blastomyces percursus]